jgi:anti-sigma factor RsiW
MRDRLPDLLHERLEASARAAVAAHVNECADCRAELALLRQVRVSLTSGIVGVDTVAIARTVVARTAPRPTSAARGARWADWRLAAAVVVLVVGGASVATVYARHGTPNDSARGSQAVIAAVPPVDTVAPLSARAAVDTAQHTTIAEATVPKASAELAAAGDVSQLSESELRTLLGDLDTIEAVPSTDPEPVTVRVSLPERGGTE